MQKMINNTFSNDFFFFYFQRSHIYTTSFVQCIPAKCAASKCSVSVFSFSFCALLISVAFG